MEKTPSFEFYVFFVVNLLQTRYLLPAHWK
jgi:hypothetical protein